VKKFNVVYYIKDENINFVGTDSQIDKYLAALQLMVEEN
jgi:hypothetical protein